MSNETTRWAARLAGAGAALLAGCSSVTRRLLPADDPTPGPTGEPGRETEQSPSPPSTTGGGRTRSPPSGSAASEPSTTPAERADATRGSSDSYRAANAGAGGLGRGAGTPDERAAPDLPADAGGAGASTSAERVASPDGGAMQPRAEVVCRDGDPEQFSDSGELTVSGPEYVCCLDVDRAYRTTVRYEATDGSPVRCHLVEADEVESGWDSATPMATFGVPSFEFGEFTLGPGRTAVVVEPVDGETTVQYGLDGSLRTDDGSTDSGSSDGSTSDGSTSDGSTDDGTDSGTDGPEWFPSVGAFRAAPPDPVTADQADWTASDRDSFVEAVRNASTGDVIWIPGDADVVMTGWADLDIADGVTIASDRNVPEGRPGGRIYVGDTDHRYLFKTYADDVRVTGLRLEGPHTEWIKSYDEGKIRSFGHFMGNNCRFDNNEVYGWPFAGFASGSSGRAVSHEFDHNHFHDNLMEGLGYGMELYNGHHSIHHNYFDRCRHAIAGFGYSDNGYEAYHNVVGPEPLSHAFDMHAVEESVSGGGDVAGGTTIVRENLFQFTHDIAGRGQEAVAVRGIPDDVARVRNNHFYHATQPTNSGGHGDAFRQGRVSDWTNFEFGGNTYDSDLSLRPPE